MCVCFLIFEEEEVLFFVIRLCFEDYFWLCVFLIDFGVCVGEVFSIKW